MRIIRVLLGMLLVTGVVSNAAKGTGTAETVAAGAIEGVLSLTPVLATSYIAVELALAPGQGVSGMRWYNSDGGAIFPRVLVVGSEGGAPVLSDQRGVGANVAGLTEDWSEIALAAPALPGGEPLYAVFQLPPFAERTGTGVGGGPALGYRRVEEAGQAYFSVDGEDWVRVGAGIQLAVEPVLVAAGGMTVTSARGGAVQVTPSEAMASQPYATELLPVVPNPGNPQVSLRFSLEAPAKAELVVFDLRGRLVRTLLAAELGAGPHVVDWKGEDDEGGTVSSGVYLARLRAGGRELTQKVAFVR